MKALCPTVGWLPACLQGTEPVKKNKKNGSYQTECSQSCVFPANHLHQSFLLVKFIILTVSIILVHLKIANDYIFSLEMLKAYIYKNFYF